MRVFLILVAFDQAILSLETVERICLSTNRSAAIELLADQSRMRKRAHHCLVGRHSGAKKMERKTAEYH